MRYFGHVRGNYLTRLGDIVSRYWFIVLFPLALCVSHPRFGYEIKWYAVALLSTLLLGIHVAKKTHWSMGLCVFYTILNGAQIAFWYETNYMGLLKPSEMGSMMFFSMQATVAFLLLFFAALSYLPKHIYETKIAIGILSAVNVLAIITQFLLGRPSYTSYGFLTNASMAACFVGFTYPFYSYFIEECRRVGHVGHNLIWKFLLSLPFIAILITGSMQGLMLLVALLAMYLWKVRKWEYLLAIPILSVIAFGLSPDEILTTGDRSAFWRMYLDLFLNHANYWQGFGIGTTHVLAVKLQLTHNWNVGNWWLWVHSDPLQLLVEMGILGVITYGICYFMMLRKTFLERNEMLFKSAVLYGLASLANFPAHAGAHALVGICIAMLCFVDKPESEFSQCH